MQVLLALAVLAALAHALAAGPICKLGHYLEPWKGCMQCPAHYYCTHDEKRPCPSGSDTQARGSSACAVAAGFYWARDRHTGTGRVVLCERDHYCAGGYEEMRACPAGTHCGAGCRAVQQCA